MKKGAEITENMGAKVKCYGFHQAKLWVTVEEVVIDVDGHEVFFPSHCSQERRIVMEP